MSQGASFDSQDSDEPVVPVRGKHVRAARVFRAPREWELLAWGPAAGIPADHPVREFAQSLSEVDLSFLEDLYDVKGGVGYPPAHLLAVVLYGMSQGTVSSRALEESCRYDARYRFLMGGHTPDDRTFGRFLSRIEPETDRLMREVLRLCRKRGLARAREVGIDGTRLPAACSQRKGKTSPREPEARTMVSADGFVLGYNAQAAVDLSDGTVVGVAVLSLENDFASAPSLMEAMERQLGELPDTVVADSGYDAPGQISALERLGVETCFSPRTELYAYVEEDEEGNPACRAGRPLSLRHVSRKAGAGYGAWGLVGCEGCPFYEPCDLRGKRIEIPLGQDPGPRVRNRGRLRSARHAGALGRRKRVERVFGDFKRNRRFRRFSRTGIAKAHAEFVLLACAHNLARAIKAQDDLFTKTRRRLQRRPKPSARRDHP